ncbi:MAG: cyclic pyranopterin monophosphate synthase MoaC [Verrucomicrobiota bacterium]
MSELTHIGADGNAAMVDVSEKAVSKREATAKGFVKMAPATVELVRKEEIAKGDVLGVARLAGIQAAKQTANLIPLCHQLPLSHVAVEFEIEEGGISIEATARTTAQTGVEMEALTAVSVAGLTIYDMCKAVDKAMELTGCEVIVKTKSQI